MKKGGVKNTYIEYFKYQLPNKACSNDNNTGLKLQETAVAFRLHSV